MSCTLSKAEEVFNANFSETYFDENYKLFSLRFPQLAKIIPHAKAKELAQEALNQVELKTAKTGETVAFFENQAFHSMYNPIKEAISIATSNGCKENETTVFFSYGLGYSALEFTKINKDKTLVIIESDLPFAFLPFFTTKLDILFAHKNLILLFGLSHDEIIGFFESQNIVHFNIVQNKAQTAHNALYFLQLTELFERNKDKNKINENTEKKFGKLWTRNTLKNIEKVSFLPGIDKLENMTKKESPPICILAAGPSLQEILPHIKQIQKKCILICVDTALRMVQKTNVNPDFTILMDSQYWNYRHLDFTQTEKTTLISELSVYPSVFNRKWKHIFLCDSRCNTAKKIQQGASYGTISSGGSVATSAWDFARIIGCSDIFMAGLDLSYPKNQTHAKGAVFETKASYDAYRIGTIEKFSAATQFSLDTTDAKDYNGNVIRTDSRMKMYAWWFESKIATEKDTKTWNLSKKSLAIPGIEYFPVESLLNLPNLPLQLREKIEKTESSAELSPENKKFSEIRKQNANAFFSNTDI